MSWIAEYDTQGREFPTCVHVTKTTGTMTHGVTYVPIEDGKAVRAENAKLREELDAAKHDLSVFSGEIVAAKAENSKLRELFADFWAWADPPFALKSGTFEQFMAIADRARKLEIEVDG